MTAATQDRATTCRAGDDFEYPQKGATKVYAGTLVAMLAGLAQPAAANASMKIVGVAQAQSDNTTGADGAINAKVRRGCWRFANSTSTDLITLSDVGNSCYVVDDSTVAKTSNSSARPVAGTVVQVDAGGVWVRVGI